MFKPMIKIHSKTQITCGTTTVPSAKTYADIIALLGKMGCDRVVTDISGNAMTIAFQLDGVPYIIQVPQVFVKSVYNERIGIRIVFHFLKSMLNLVKERAIDPSQLFLATRIIDGANGPFGWLMRQV